MHFLLAALSIVLIDLLLAGDNALVIAMGCELYLSASGGSPSHSVRLLQSSSG